MYEYVCVCVCVNPMYVMTLIQPSPIKCVCVEMGRISKKDHPPSVTNTHERGSWISYRMCCCGVVKFRYVRISLTDGKPTPVTR